MSGWLYMASPEAEKFMSKMTSSWEVDHRGQVERLRQVLLGALLERALASRETREPRPTHGCANRHGLSLPERFLVARTPGTCPSETLMSPRSTTTSITLTTSTKLVLGRDRRDCHVGLSVFMRCSSRRRVTFVRAVSGMPHRLGRARRQDLVAHPSMTEPTSLGRAAGATRRFDLLDFVEVLVASTPR